jgi:hypothetical protein
LFDLDADVKDGKKYNLCGSTYDADIKDEAPLLRRQPYGLVLDVM